MKCLIIAAGKGTRMAGKGSPKPLMPLLGLPLIERVILTAKKAGIDDFYVVTGYRGEEVRAFLDGLRSRREVRITHIINNEWERGNGVSVLKARNILKENFILLMADHIVDEDIIRGISVMNLQPVEVVAGVDFRVDSNRFVDMRDVTKVLSDNGRLKDAGKEIQGYNGYDTGVFYCSPSIFEAIERSIRESGDDSLSGGINVLAREGRVGVFDIGERFWMDIDNEASLKKAEEYLLNILRKPSDGPVSRYLNRPLSMRITRYIVKKDITPNQITSFSFIISLLSAILFSFPNYFYLLLGSILAQLSSIVDGCDGEVARLKFNESEFGKWVDAVLDRYADAFMLFGLTYHSFIHGGIVNLIAGFLAIIGSFMNSYTADKYDGLMRRLKKGGRTFRIGRDVRVFLIFLGGIANQTLITLSAIAILMNVENIRRVFLCYVKRDVAFS
jgi:CDP-L-myo-inositol myo-inositolphosphotransferase